MLANNLLKKILILKVLIILIYSAPLEKDSKKEKFENLKNQINDKNSIIKNVNFLEKKSLTEKIGSNLSTNTNSNAKLATKMLLNTSAKTDSSSKFEIMEMPHLKKGNMKLNLLINIRNSKGCNKGKKCKCKKPRECKDCKDCKYEECKNEQICKSDDCQCRKCQDCDKEQCKDTELCLDEKCKCEDCDDCDKKFCKDKEICQKPECKCLDCKDCCRDECKDTAKCNEVECKLKLLCHSCKDCDKEFCFHNFPKCENKCKFRFCHSCLNDHPTGKKKKFCDFWCKKCDKDLFYEDCDDPLMEGCRVCKDDHFTDYCEKLEKNKNSLGYNFKFGMQIPNDSKAFNEKNTKERNDINENFNYRRELNSPSFIFK